MSWQGIRGHDRIAESLSNRLRLGRFPHALLFVGPEGIGKRALARKLAQGLLCETRPAATLDPCGTCPGCIQVAGGTHPDFIETGRPEDRHELPIAVVRELCDQFAYKPARGTYKVAIVDDADLLNEEASNAFLKTLEEPPPGTVLILIGTSAELQLETIVSRCQVVRFDPLPEAEIAALLLELGEVADPALAARLAALGQGSVSRALGLADPELERFRRILIDEVAGPHGFEPSGLANRLLTHIRTCSKDSVDQRARASLLVGELARFLRGVLSLAAGYSVTCPDPDDHRATVGLAGRVTPEAVMRAAERCIDADYHLRRRLYAPLIVSSLMHDLGKMLSART